MCLGAIYWARLKAIYYANTSADAKEIGFDDSHIYKEISKPLAEREIPFIKLENAEAKAGFAAWAAYEDRVRY